MTNEDYCAVISHNAGGYSFYKDCRTDRISRWAPENYHFDRPGRFVYLRDPDSGQYWSATYQPVRQKPDFYESRHGLGYTAIRTSYHGIDTEAVYFVPLKDTCEIWLYKVTNNSEKQKKLEIFPYVEWLLGDYHEELRYRNIMVLYNRVYWDPKTEAILARKTAFWENMNIQPFPYLAFLASSLPYGGCVTQKERFLGRYNNEEKPEAIAAGQWQNQEFCSGEESVGVLRHAITLAPGESKEFVIVMGQTKGSAAAVRSLVDRYRDVDRAKKNLEQVKEFWRRRVIENITVKTPDADFDCMVNVWLKYQVMICNYWSRSPSFFHEGSGGRGYRDSCQDGEAIVSIDPKLTRRRIEILAALIRQDGTCAPGFSDTKGAAGHRPNKDHPLWLTQTVSGYVKETGDKKILLKKFPYLKDKWVRGWDINPKWKEKARAAGSGTLYEHLKRNLEFAFRDTGKRGLPKIGHADWNDAIDAAGKLHRGESAWMAQALVRSLKTLAELAQIINKSKDAKELLRKAQVMTDRINTICWDGDWYLRGFTDFDAVYGSKKNKEGKIFLNTQGWALLSGVAQGERLQRVLSSMDRYLDGEHGYALFYPAYSTYDSRLGRISMFTEGTKENAAVFCHAAMFATVGLCVVGEGDRAYRALRKILPNAQKDYDLYKTEPYVLAEYLAGPQHPYAYGEGAFTWITGSSGWGFMAATEWILGTRRDFNGLKIDPCIPSHWKQFEITRPFRGAVYHIKVENPNGVQRGVREIYVGGVRQETNLLVPKEKKTYDVRVIMG
ncbi:MAG: hypothetical protein HYS56_05735 [Candidatus Omnitrophica bacterium]|nr:hypothetical protein [Candidatus Omnitrophota bacterium]